MTIANDSGTSISVWMRTRVPAYDDPLPVEARCDVCVIGAGIAGISVAHGACRLGLDVIVIDDGPLIGGETARSTAHVASAIDDRYYEIERHHGTAIAQLVAQSHAEAIDRIEANVTELGIDCDFQRVDGYLFVPPGRPLAELDRELAAAARAGLVVTMVDRAPLPFDTGPALRFEHQAQIDPVAYVRGLAAALDAREVRIRTGVHAREVIPTDDGVWIKLQGERRIFARHVVDATNTTITSRTRLPIRQAAYRTYVIAAEVPIGAVTPALYWDTADPYHYVRVARDVFGRELVLIGGEDHRTGQDVDPARHWKELEHWARARFPRIVRIVDRWSGQIMEPADGLAYIGRSPDLERVFIVTGDSGNGITHGTIAGIVLPELIAGRDHLYAHVYDPRRSKLRAVGSLVREAVSSATPYVDWLGGGDVLRLADIPRGGGAVLRRGVHLIATYRDDHGQLFECSARCPHLSGVVSWNPAEHTWDCPCHGSRFDPYGRVINGPANADLAPPPVRPLDRRELPRRERVSRSDEGAAELDYPPPTMRPLLPGT